MSKKNRTKMPNNMMKVMAINSMKKKKERITTIKIKILINLRNQIKVITSQYSQTYLS